MTRTHRLAPLAATALVVTLAACSSSVTQTANTTTPGSRPAAATPGPGIGGTHNLQGNTGQRLTVRLDKVLPTAHGDSQQPAPGHRYMAVELTITNTGTARLAEGPWISTTVSDAAGHQYDPATVLGITDGPEMPGEVKTPPGQARTGWIVFEVPTAARIIGVEYGAAGGAGDTADWTI